MGTTVTIGPCTSVINYTLLGVTDHLAERKEWMLQVTRENQGIKVVKLRILKGSIQYDVWKHFVFPVSTTEKEEKVMGRQKRIYTDTPGL